VDDQLKINAEQQKTIADQQKHAEDQDKLLQSLVSRLDQMEQAEAKSK